ncbi:lanthionine synthetase C family protein [Bacillus paranthracis]|uniref:lanthionine synthetase C family protein n=1 Tax=Bacillus paranthracis TaxID=2026186 RepID=UPI000200F781|nr:lanthionine synthetase C family protein [Bacillus paranthracis]ADY20442.1 Lanthionine synthetase C family protein [Bacillus thuringiensis serovar finitimus YBT-020]MCR6799289.1 lanthionine synthetase C family protein [Bacillus paranthracis]MEC3358552.1 lanthionine synthetase C family protein [Bacillus paranthracis]MED0785547.1 lanthionine synthetase C family protein [Bacillus paranthracis]MED0809161.1 lanthionine synthetase C family protein [Bacillus paranthracis]
MEKERKREIILQIEKKASEQIHVNPDYTFLLDYVILSYYLSVFDSKNTDFKTNKYFLKGKTVLDNIIEDINKYQIPLGAWYGYTGIAYIINAYGGSDEYYNFLRKLNSFIKFQSHKMISSYNWKKNGMFSGFYDLINGVSGIGRYFISFDRIDYNYLKFIINWIIGIVESSDKYESEPLEGFFIKKDKIVNPQYMIKYRAGYVDMGLSHGVIGCLFLLAKAKEAGVKIANLDKTIDIITQRYLTFIETSQDLFMFPTVLKKEDDGKFSPQYLRRSSWCYGSTGILRALHLIGNMLGRRDIVSCVEQQINLMGKVDITEFGLECPTFCHGYSGLYHVLNLFEVESKSISVDEQVKSLEDKIWNSGSKKNPYYFKKVDKNPDTGELIFNTLKMSSIDGVFSILIPYLIKEQKPDNDFFSKSLFLL